MSTTDASRRRWHPNDPSGHIIAANRRDMEVRDMAVTLTRSAGMLLLGIWLILAGMGAMVALPVPGIVTGVIALLAGILILIGR